MSTRFLTAVFSFWLASTATPAQDKPALFRLDSVRLQLKAISTDTGKAVFLYDAMRNFYNYATSETDYQLAEKCANWLDSLARQTENAAIYTEAFLAKSTVENMRGNQAEALIHSKTALQWALKTNDKNRLARTYDKLADAYQDLENWEYATNYRLLALRNFESVGDEIRVGYAYGDIASVFIQQNEFSKAVAYARKSVDLFHRIGTAEHLSVAYNQLAAATMGTGDAQKAIEYQKNALGYFQKIHDVHNEIVGLNNLAEYYSHIGDHTKAVALVQQSILMEHKFGQPEPYWLVAKYLNLGSFYTKNKQYHQAEAALIKAIALAKEAQSPLRLMQGYEFLAQTYNASGKPVKAAELYPKVLLLKDSIFQETKARQILNLNIQYETEKKEQAITNLQEQNRKQQIINWILAGLGVAAVGLVAFLIRAFWLQKRLHQSQKQLAEQEKQLEAEKNLRLQAEMEAKQRELLSARVFIQQKNELLESLQDQLQEVTVGATANQEPLRQMSRSIRQNIRFDDDWERIKLHFEGVHPGFFQQLKQTGPTLSDHELRHCAYIKMKFSTKEIANLLSIDANSVKVSRYRIKKKLNLDAETDLPDYLSTL